jgi:hypothetical protein
MFYLEPKFCLLFGDKADWHEVVDSAENAQTTNEQFGNSEQLPDWVKVGNLVYCRKTGIYGEVTAIGDNNIYIRIVNSDEVFPAKLNMALRNGRPARKRPLNADEMKALVGRFITIENQIAMVIGYNKSSNRILIWGSNFLSAEQLINLEVTINGKPCYKLEHLEEGEWVE